VNGPGPGSPGTVFVTGAAGFIGSALCERLLAAGSRVVAFDNFSRGSREYVPGGAAIVEADIRDQACLKEALTTARPDCVVHLAAMHFIPECIANPEATLDVNVRGTRCVLDACRETRVGRVIVASSAAVYAPVDTPCDEDRTPLGPLEVYGESKVQAEQLVTVFHQDTGVPSTILRLFNAVGRRETNPHVIPHIFESLQRGNEIPLGNVAPRRDYVDTRDIADAIVSVMSVSSGLHVVNVGTGRAYSVGDVVDLLRQILGRPIRIRQDEARARASERMLLLAGVDKIRTLSGWRARVPLEDTLRDLVQAYGL
jgi:UDP-glucose 4-epimerase